MITFGHSLLRIPVFARIVKLWSNKFDCILQTVTKSEPSEKVLSSDAQPPQVITELRRSYTNKLEEVCFYGNRMF